MRALVFDDCIRLRDDYPNPKRPPGEALVGVRLAGICATDLQIIRGYGNYQGVLGHEFVGEVLEADEPAWLGARVVADINAGCGRCAQCSQYAGHHCENRTTLGIMGRDGAMADRLLIPEHCLVRVPKDVPDEAAVFAEPLAAALHVLDDLRGAPPARVFVLGDGKLGLLIAMALHRNNAHNITLVGHHTENLAIAAGVGVATRLEREDPVRPREADVVVDATGNPAALSAALRMLRPRGTLILKTGVADPVQLDTTPIVVDELRIIGSRCGNMAEAIAALADGHIDPTPLIAARYDLRDAQRAMAHAAQPGTLKVLVAPEW